MIQDARLIFSILKTQVTNSIYPLTILKQHFKLVFPKQNIDQLCHNIGVAFDKTYKGDDIFIETQ